MVGLQFTQDNNPIGMMIKYYAEQFGEIKSIRPYYENFLNPVSFDTDRNQLVFLVEAGFDLIDVGLEASFDLYFGDGLTEFHTVFADIVSVQPPNTYFQHTTLIHNRFIKAVRNVVNIEYAYAFGYSIRYTTDIFNVIP